MIMASKPEACSEFFKFLLQITSTYWLYLNETTSNISHQNSPVYDEDSIAVYKNFYYFSKTRKTN